MSMKRFMFILLSMLIFCSTISVTADYGNREQGIIFKNKNIVISDSFVKNEKIYVPIRELLEKMDYSVSWDGPNYSIQISDDDTFLYPEVKEKIIDNFNMVIASPSSGLIDGEVKYTYTPQSTNLNYKEFVKSMGLTGTYFGNRGYAVPDPETAVRLTRFYYDEADIKRTYDVTYDMDNSAWIVSSFDEEGEPTLIMPHGLVINSYDGQLLYMYSLDPSKVNIN